VLGLVWNIRDESVPWVAALSRAMHGSHAERMLSADGVRVGAPFDGLEQRTWSWTRTLSRSALIDMVSSRSYVITASDAERGAILAEVGRLFDEHRVVDAAGTEVVDLPYTTHAYRGIRP
jgi:hypothetical protein